MIGDWRVDLYVSILQYGLVSFDRYIVIHDLAICLFLL